MNELPILTFEPLLKEVVWGGRKMERLLDRELPGDAPIGESWEVVDLPTDQSVVASGPLAGQPLAELLTQYGEALLGGVSLLGGRFPVLLKYIDANQTLSVQVHPDEAACARLGGGARPKTEAWYIIECERDAVLYVGLREGVDRTKFAAAIEEGSVEDLLHRMPVEPGDYIFLPSGTVHAIGAGIVLAEVQQSSDTTYRVFDWNRVGLDGKPRQLHVAAALESIDYAQVGPPSSEPPPSGRPGVSSASFCMETVALGDGEVATLDGDGPLIAMGIGGAGGVAIEAAGSTATLALGQTALVPACRASSVRLTADGEISLLAVRIPA